MLLKQSLIYFNFLSLEHLKQSLAAHENYFMVSFANFTFTCCKRISEETFSSILITKIGRAFAHGARVIGSIPHVGPIKLFHVPSSAS